ncbi:MAG: hypothetical protein M1417_01775, partial [Candidatus Thermoplasmatota archaeon]|nr:hypothetical protein [Candidatus Thermoplasmatota archaeon]
RSLFSTPCIGVDSRRNVITGSAGRRQEDRKAGIQAYFTRSSYEDYDPVRRFWNMQSRPISKPAALTQCKERRCAITSSIH